ncbi:DUF2147 domain-containing protein [Pseudovibrio sp. Ad26]|uniref:DUF2147 domain-containing protein n=1 Tax=Pseudovibrio sp. Ad26 TaxID=989410 RepID=UPI0007AE48C5|nr:DUF2147 domain-containing protein [Pseudovibrio sp. Ad26]KZL05816.1 hypothetical protein PsAD26_03957 [Pseudovibrio sp. Ad26]
MIRSGFIFGFIFLSTSLVTVAKASDLHGLWQTTKGAIISISQCGSTMCGQLQSFKPPDGKRQQDILDTRNQDRAKRGRKVLGLRVLWNIKAAGENKWYAEGYDPRRGYEITINIDLLPSGLLKMTGCKKIVLNFCENVIWQRP